MATAEMMMPSVGIFTVTQESYLCAVQDWTFGKKKTNRQFAFLRVTGGK